MRVLISCETSGVVRQAFTARGHDAWSCDLLPAEDRSNRHIVGDIRDLLNDGWDLLAVMHPPCTRLCNSGVRWLREPSTKLSSDVYALDIVAAYATWDRERRLAFMRQCPDEGAALFSACWNAPIERIAVENPVMHRHAKSRIVNFARAAQTVQPHWFGERVYKATGLYLKNLPPLAKTKTLTPLRAGTAEHKAWSAVHRASPGRNRWKVRSRTFDGIPDAMADQWGRLDQAAVAGKAV